MATTVPAEDPQKPNIEAVLDEKLHISEPTTTEVASSSKDPSIAGNGIVTDQPADSEAAPEGTVAEEKQLESSVHPEIPPTGPVKAPFPHPLPQCKPAPHADLTADQQKKYDELLKLVASWTTVPATSARFGAAKDPITDDDRLWLTRECLLRYLRATKFVSASAAATRLQQTLTWRREYGLHKFTPEYISPENETGKQVILGYDNDGRPCLYLNPSKQNTQKSDRQLHHLVYMLEKVIDLMPEGQETSALLINFKETSNGSGPSVAQGRATLVILQGHYPERLGRALISERKHVQSPSHCYRTNTFSNSAVVHIDLFQTDICLHRPRHQIEDEVQRAARQPCPRRSTPKSLRWRSRLRIRS